MRRLSEPRPTLRPSALAFSPNSVPELRLAPFAHIPALSIADCCTHHSTMASPSALSFLVLGTGTSSAPPAIKCLTSPDTGCLSCRQTLLPPSDPAYAAGQQNIRRNTSGVLRIPGKNGEREKTLLIDVSLTKLGTGGGVVGQVADWMVEG